MTKQVSNCGIWIMALLCVGCDPPENTSTPASRNAPAETTRPFTFNSSDATYCIRFSPDGKMLASANLDKSVSLWDVQTRQESARLTGHLYPAVSLAFTPDGNFLASVGDDYHTRKGEILVWDVRTRSVSRTLESQDVYSSFACFSPDGKTLASAGPRNSITLWDVETWTLIRTLEPHNNPVHLVEFSADGKLLAAGVSHYNRTTQQAEVKLWNLESGESVGTLEHRWDIRSVCFSSDGTTLTVANPGQIILWDVETQVEQKRFEDSFSSWATYSPDGSLIAMRGQKNITLCDTESWKEIGRQDVETHTNQAFFSPDGKSLAWGSVAKGEPIRLWDLSQLMPLVNAP